MQSVQLENLYSGLILRERKYKQGNAMISPKEFFDFLIRQGIGFFTGVPDSLLKDFCAYVEDNAANNHIIAANEGNAIAIASGFHLATGRFPLVYMQNSGLGNSINPLASLADQDLFSIPILIIVGWRGEPGTEDEPQHVKQGKITLPILETVNIPYAVLPQSQKESEETTSNLLKQMKSESRPVALVVTHDSFEPYTLKEKDTLSYPLTREQSIAFIADSLPETALIVSTTGKTSRELFEYRGNRGQPHARDFLTVGSMGHCSSIALGIASQQPQRDVYCFDGDGALIMHMGSLAVIGAQGQKNFKHIIFNNGSHDSVGGQPTAGFSIDIPKIALACGYRQALRAETEQEVKAAMEKIAASMGPSLLEVRVNKGSRKDLGRPTTTPLENKKAFMEFLHS